MENMPIGRFSASLPCKNHIAAVGGILISGGFAAIFAGLLYLMHFAGESPGYASLKSGRPTYVHHSRIGLARRYIFAKHAAHSAAAAKLSLRKLKL
jgi:hypothetical protein